MTILAISSSLGSEDREQMSVNVFEVGNPIRRCGLTRFGGESHAALLQGLVRSAHAVDLKNDLSCSGDMGSKAGVAAAQAQEHVAALQQGKSRLLHDHLEPKFVLIKRQGRGKIPHAQHDGANS